MLQKIVRYDRKAVLIYYLAIFYGFLVTPSK